MTDLELHQEKLSSYFEIIEVKKCPFCGEIKDPENGTFHDRVEDFENYNKETSYDEVVFPCLREDCNECALDTDDNEAVQLIINFAKSIKWLNLFKNQQPIYLIHYVDTMIKSNMNIMNYYLKKFIKS